MLKSFLHYKIDKKLGEGGMGIVYRARDTKLKRRVALKFLSRSISLDSSNRHRFRKEAQAAAALNHPNIAQVYAIEEVDNELCIVMEYVEGKVLKEVIDEEEPTVEEKLRIAEKIAIGLRAAHQKGIIHRDIKAQNIMIDAEGRIKIMDFGLAYLEGSDPITKTGKTVGTTAYMAPEQLAGQDANIRSDIWSYGIVLYQLFAGVLPFQGKYEAAVMYAVAEEDPEPISNKEIPERIRHVIFRCLEKDPDNRYHDMDQLIEDFSGPKLSTRKGDFFPAFPTSKKLTKAGYVVIPIALIVGALTIFLPFDRSMTGIAVLPIESIGNDTELAAMSEGLTETLSYKLSELKKFGNSYWIAPAREMRNEQIRSVSKANKEFGVDLVIMSTIQMVEDSTRLILELVDAQKAHRLQTKQVVVSSANMALIEQEGIKAMLDILEIEISERINKTLKEGEPSQPEAYEFYLRGLASLQGASIDSLDHAIRFFSQATEIDPEFALGYSGKGEAYWRKYEFTGDITLVDRAEEALQKALSLNKQLAPVQSLLGKVRAGIGEYDQAISHYERALKIDPKYSPAYRGLAGVYEEQGQMEQAEQVYLHAIELKPEYWFGYNDLGKLYVRMGNFLEAIEEFKKVVDIIPNSSTAHANLGVAYFYNGQVDLARQMFERSMALEKSFQAASNLASIYYSEGKFSDAAKMFEIALETYPTHYVLWGNLAAAYEKMSESKKAHNAYLKAIEQAQKQLDVNPKDAELLADIGAYYSDVRDSTNALKYLSKALELNDENIEVRSRAVSTYEQLGMREQALRWLDPAITSYIESNPEFEQLVVDPRYKAWKTKTIVDNND